MFSVETTQIFDCSTNAAYTCQTKSKRIWRLWLEGNDKDLFKALRVCKLEIQLSNDQCVTKKKEKLSILIVFFKSTL